MLWPTLYIAARRELAQVQSSVPNPRFPVARDAALAVAGFLFSAKGKQ
jgi:hypothetical protein